MKILMSRYSAGKVNARPGQVIEVDRETGLQLIAAHAGQEVKEEKPKPEPVVEETTQEVVEEETTEKPAPKPKTVTRGKRGRSKKSGS